MNQRGCMFSVLVAACVVSLFVAITTPVSGRTPLMVAPNSGGSSASASNGDMGSSENPSSPDSSNPDNEKCVEFGGLWQNRPNPQSWDSSSYNGPLFLVETSAAAPQPDEPNTSILGPVDPKSGGAQDREADLRMPSLGPDWYHTRSYSSVLDASAGGDETEQGWLWRHSLMIELVSAEEAYYEDRDITMVESASEAIDFINTATDTWQVEHYKRLTLTHDAGNDRFVLALDNGNQWRFRDFEYATITERGKLYEVRDAYGNTLTISYDGSGRVSSVDDHSGHHMTYAYSPVTGANDKLTTVRLFKAASETDANLIGQIDYDYYDNTYTNGGSPGDLALATSYARATNDADGVLSISKSIHYRYWTGSYGKSHPGSDHLLKYVVSGQNFSDLSDSCDYLTATDTQVAEFANTYFEYDSSSRVSQLQERSGSCSSCGGGATDVGTTGFTWNINPSAPGDYNTWKVHCKVDREDDTRIFFDVNKGDKLLTWVFQDENDGTPNQEWIWHREYSSHNRLTRSLSPSACSSYDENAPYSVSGNSSTGLVRVYDYFGAGSYEDYLLSESIMQGTSGTAVKVVEYGRTSSNRPDLTTSVTQYESDSGGGSSGQQTTYAYQFYSGTNSQAIKQITITHPTVSEVRNGSDVATVEYQYYDNTGKLRWTKDGEGFVNYYGYDDDASGTGRPDLTIVDVDTSTLPASVTADWDGTSNGFANYDDIPFEREIGLASALSIESSAAIDFAARLRKTTDAEGDNTYYVYKDGETRVYPKWDSTNEDCDSPWQVITKDKSGRTVETITMSTSATIATSSGQPTGAESLSKSDYVTWTKNEYNTAGQLTATNRYHDIPSSGDGARYANFFRVEREYNNMGRLEYVIEDVADTSPQNYEQITQNVYDVRGRVIETKLRVSNETHDISIGKPTMYTTKKFEYDGGGVGDGNLTKTETYYTTAGTSHYDSRYQYDWRNRRCVTVPPDGPYSLTSYDNLGRVVASATFSSTNGLDAGDDPADSGLAANRLTLNATHYDQIGRVYKTERFLDPSVSTPADVLTSNTYYDRRGLTVATDSANSGVTETVYDGAGRRVQTRQATELNSSKYSSGAFNYLGDDDKIVEAVDYTLDNVGRTLETVRYTLNHDDTDGLDLTNADDGVRTYVYNWYDSAGRLSHTANYGTANSNGWEDATPPTRQSTPPASSNSVLVTQYGYNDQGRRATVTAPNGAITETEYDDRGKTIAKTEDYGTGKLNRKTEYQYNAQGSLVRIMHDPDADNTFANGVWTTDGTDIDQVTEYAYTANNPRWVKEIRYPTGDGTVGTLDSDKIRFGYNLDGKVTKRNDQNGSEIRWGYDAGRRKTSELLHTVGSGVDETVRAITWTYDDSGRPIYVTTHWDTLPDTSSWTDTVNQIKNTYDDSGYLTKQEQEFAGPVNGSSKAVEFGYTYSSTDNYKRLDYVEYPDDTRIWRGYDHSDELNTFQDQINDAFSRVGQLAFGTTTKGDVIAEYDFNGRNRMVRRNHTSGSGWAGNDTRLDLWNGTTGTYDGLDQFGRIADLKVVDYTGTPTNLEQRIYSHDLAGNPTVIDNTILKSRSMELTYDKLNRLVLAQQGFLVGDEVYNSDLVEGYNMDLLGNLTAAAGGFMKNSASTTVSHVVSPTNEIKAITNTAQAGQARAFFDDFNDGDLIDFWTTKEGFFYEDNGYNEIRVTSVNSSCQYCGGPDDMAALVGQSTEILGTYEVKVTLPSSGAAGIVVNKDGAKYTVARIEVGTSSNVEIFHFYRMTAGLTWHQGDPASATIVAGTQYLLRVNRRLRGFDFQVLTADGSTVLAETSREFDTDIRTGTFGLYAENTNVKFDDFAFTRLDQMNSSSMPRWSATAKTDWLSATSELQVDSLEYGGKAILDWAGDDEYITQADIDLNGGDWAELVFRYQDPDNYYAARIGKDEGGGTGPVQLIQVVRGMKSVLASNTYTTASSVELKVKVTSADAVTVWVDSTQKISGTYASDISSGSVALASEKALFSDVEVGYDTGADDSIDDFVVEEDFSTNGVRPTYDANGNLTYDGMYTYVYDGWNRLVKASRGGITIQESEYDGLGRRIRKVVTNSGDLDSATVYYYNGNQIIETRDGSDNLETQVYHGTRYIDEIVGMRLPQGRVYLHQDANYNVIAMTDLTGRELERYHYTPYGELEVSVESHMFDYDDDGDVDENDIAAGTSGGVCWNNYSGDCVRLDSDCDEDIDVDDYNAIVAYVDTLSSDTEVQRVPSTTSSKLGNMFGHQGLVFDAEIESYQNRARQYAPKAKRFMQRDPLVLTGGRMRTGSVARRLGSNLYYYLSGRVLDRVDPLGLKDTSVTACQCKQAISDAFENDDTVAAIIDAFAAYPDCATPGVLGGGCSDSCLSGGGGDTTTIQTAGVTHSFICIKNPSTSFWFSGAATMVTRTLRHELMHSLQNCITYPPSERCSQERANNEIEAYWVAGQCNGDFTTMGCRECMIHKCKGSLTLNGCDATQSESRCATAYDAFAAQVGTPCDP